MCRYLWPPGLVLLLSERQVKYSGFHTFCHILCCSGLGIFLFLFSDSVFVYAHICMYTCICVCAYVCVCVCVNGWCKYGPYIGVCVEEVRDHG